jgi:hypothetical protein
VPAPVLFQQDFTKAAYKLLPRRMFLQYLSNDVLSLDEVILAIFALLRHCFMALMAYL